MQLFDEVKVFKPMASRSKSSETYLLALRYKAPAKIPSHLLDYRQLFKYTAEPKKVVMIAIYVSCIVCFDGVFSATPT